MRELVIYAGSAVIALALGLGTIVFSDYMRPDKRLQRQKEKRQREVERSYSKWMSLQDYMKWQGIKSIPDATPGYEAWIDEWAKRQDKKIVAEQLANVESGKADHEDHFALASRYALGNGVEESQEKAREHWKKAVSMANQWQLKSWYETLHSNKNEEDAKKIAAVATVSDSLKKKWRMDDEFQRVMDYYEGRNGKPMKIHTAFSMFHKLVEQGHAPAMNAVACMYYHGEDPGQRRFAGSTDLAKLYWTMAAERGNEAAKDNINRLIRRR